MAEREEAMREIRGPRAAMACCVSSGGSRDTMRGLVSGEVTFMYPGRKSAGAMSARLGFEDSFVSSTSAGVAFLELLVAGGVPLMVCRREASMSFRRSSGLGGGGRCGIGGRAWVIGEMGMLRMEGWGSGSGPEKSSKSGSVKSKMFVSP